MFVCLDIMVGCRATTVSPVQQMAYHASKSERFKLKILTLLSPLNVPSFVSFLSFPNFSLLTMLTKVQVNVTEFET